MAGAYQEEDSKAAAAAAAQQAEGGEDEEDEDASVPWLRCEAVTHLSLAEKPSGIADYLKTLPGPTAEELKMGHDCPASERDALLTRSVLVLCAVENLRDANTLLRTYISDIESRDVDDLKKSYMDKKDGRAPAHIIFCSMLLRVCEKEIKTGPLYTWLLKSFGSELSRMFKPDVVRAYCTKIGTGLLQYRTAAVHDEHAGEYDGNDGWWWWWCHGRRRRQSHGWYEPRHDAADDAADAGHVGWFGFGF